MQIHARADFFSIYRAQKRERIGSKLLMNERVVAWSLSREWQLGIVANVPIMLTDVQQLPTMLQTPN